MQKEKSWDVSHCRTGFIVNSPQRICTFDNIRGKSKIDVTLCTKSIAGKLRDWKIYPYQTTSDHNLIMFEIVRITQEINTRSKNRFNTKRADWEAYRTHLWTQIEQIVENDNDAQLFSEKIVNAILEAGNKSIPKKKIFSKSVPWWNSQLTELRTKMFEARHRIQRTGDKTDFRERNSSMVALRDNRASDYYGRRFLLQAWERAFCSSLQSVVN